MAKYANNLLMFRSGGRFAKPPSLSQLGYDVNDRERTCANCGEKWFPVLATGRCPKCDTPLGSANSGDGKHD